jgi:hypothetical protein
MSGSIIEQRGRVLEDAFFARQDEVLIERLREADRAATDRQALAAASGISDATVLDHLLALGIGAQAFAALALVPLVLVAWADGTLDAGERDAVRAAAREAGLSGRPEAMALLDAWLSRPPPLSLQEAWHDYAHAIAATAPAATRVALAEQTVERARRVAAAAGGFFGLGNRVSAAEERVLTELRAAFA